MFAIRTEMVAAQEGNREKVVTCSWSVFIVDILNSVRNRTKCLKSLTKKHLLV